MDYALRYGAFIPSELHLTESLRYEIRLMRTEQPTAPSWNSATSMWQQPEINHVPYDAEILWTRIWNWMYGKTDLYETARP